jgi:MFS family permease
MKSRISQLSRRFGDPAFLTLILFGIEGIFLQYSTSINGYGNNLYATNMGASDAQIGLIQLIPNLVAFAALLPLGILSDRMKSSKTMPLLTLLVLAISYFGLGTVPILGESRMFFFFFFLAFTVGGIAIYNAQWQAFFGDVTPLRDRNRVYAFRNRFMFIVGIIAPIICGFLMGAKDTTDGKLFILRIFFYLCGTASLLQAIAIARIPGGNRSPESLAELTAHRFSARDVWTAIRTVATNRQFLWFFFPVLFLHMSWHLDWSMWYIGQTQYCGMDEASLSIYNGIFNVGQLIAVGIMANINRRKSPDFTILFGILGLITCPLTMMFVPLLPLAARPVSFIIINTILNAPQCAVGLCVVQLLLKATPEKNRSLIVSLYTMIITLSNSLMPYLGVELYTALGADTTAVYLFNTIVLVLRCAAFALLLVRYNVAKREGFLVTAE